MMLTVNLRRIGLTDPQHTEFPTGHKPIILGVDQPSFVNLTANPRALSSRNIAKKLASACRRAGSLSEAPEGRGRRHTGGGAPV